MVDPTKIKVFTDPDYIEKQLTEEELASLVDAFKHLKSNHHVDIFGKDAPYDHLNTLPSVKQAELRHVHIIDVNIVWPPRKPHPKRTSDKHLVYCTGYMEKNCYLLIAVLNPEAHKKAFDRSLMLNMAKTAEIFRDKH